MEYNSIRKNSSDSNNNSITNINSNNNNNNKYGTKAYIGRDNYCINSYNNKNINSPKTPSYVTDIDSNNLKSIKILKKILILILIIIFLKIIIL